MASCASGSIEDPAESVFRETMVYQRLMRSDTRKGHTRRPDQAWQRFSKYPRHHRTICSYLLLHGFAVPPTRDYRQSPSRCLQHVFQYGRRHTCASRTAHHERVFQAPACFPHKLWFSSMLHTFFSHKRSYRTWTRV